MVTEVVNKRGSLWVEDEKIGSVVAFTYSLNTDLESVPAKRRFSGTLVFSDVNFPLYYKHFSPHEVKRVENVVVKLSPVVEGYPMRVNFTGFVIWNEGWGWSEDDTVSEFAVTWSANDIDFIL